MQNTKQMEFTVIIEESEGWFVGQLAELPAVMSQGKTKDELMYNLRSALKDVLAYERERALKNNKIVEKLLV